MRFDVTPSVDFSQQLSVLNDSLDDPNFVDALREEKNYLFAMEVFAILLKEESLLEENKELITRLIPLIKPEDLNGPLGDQLHRATQKLHDLGVFELMCRPQTLSAFHPNTLWMLSGSMRRKMREGSSPISFAESSAEKTKYSFHVVRLITEYRKSQKLELLLKSLLQSVSANEHMLLLEGILELSKSFDLDGFQEHFKEAIQKCQIDLLPPSFNGATVEDYRQLAHDYELPLLDCAIDHYENPSCQFPASKESTAIELIEKLLSYQSLKKCEIFISLLTYLFNGITLKGIQGKYIQSFEDCKCIGDKLTKLGIINPIKSLKFMFRSREFFNASHLMQHKKALALVSPFFLRAFKSSVSLPGMCFMDRELFRKDFFNSIDEAVKLAEQWNEPELKKHIESGLLYYQADKRCGEENVSTYLEISKKHEFPLLLYISLYYLNPKDPLLTDSIHQPTIVQLFSKYAKCERSMWRKDLFCHLFRLLEFENIPSFLECQKWVKPYLLDCSLEETTNKKEGAEKEVIKISLKNDPEYQYLLSKRVLKFIAPSVFTRFEVHQKENDFLIYDCSGETFDFFMRHLSKGSAQMDLLMRHLRTKKTSIEFLKELIDLAKMWQLDELKEIIERHLIESVLCIENAQAFLNVDWGMPLLTKRVHALLGHLREDAKNYTINSRKDLHACYQSSDDVKSITWGYEYPLTKEKLDRLKFQCPGLRELTLEARSLKHIEGLIDGFPYLESVIIRQSDQPVSIENEMVKLEKCKAIKLEGFLIDHEMFKKLIHLSQLESLDISMCKLNCPVYCFFTLPSCLKCLSFPLLQDKKELLATYLPLFVYGGITVHVSPSQIHFLDKKMSQAEAKEVRKQLARLIQLEFAEK